MKTRLEAICKKSIAESSYEEIYKALMTIKGREQGKGEGSQGPEAVLYIRGIFDREAAEQ